MSRAQHTGVNLPSNLRVVLEQDPMVACALIPTRSGALLTRPCNKTDYLYVINLSPCSGAVQNRAGSTSTQLWVSNDLDHLKPFPFDDSEAFGYRLVNLPVSAEYLDLKISFFALTQMQRASGMTPQRPYLSSTR
jgi:hypothetical protein